MRTRNQAILYSSPRRGGLDINQNFAKQPLWSGRGGDQAPAKSDWWRITTPSARLRMLRSIFLIAQPPLLEEEGKGRSFTFFLALAILLCSAVSVFGQSALDPLGYSIST